MGRDMGAARTKRKTISVSAKKLMRKKSKEDEQTLEELNSAHRRSQAKCQLKQTSYIKRI